MSRGLGDVYKRQVAGGLPLVIVDLLKAIFAAGDKPGGGASDEDANAAALLEDGA